MTLCAIPAPRKGHSHQGPGRDSVAKGAPKGQTLKRRLRMCQEGSSGIRDRDLKEQLRLRSKMEFNKTIRKTFGLEIARRAIEFFFGLQKMSDCTLWRSWTPETKEGTPHRVRAGDVGTLATQGSFAYIDRKKGLYCLHPVVCIMWKEG
jgi:hypothetical protein